MHAPNATTQAPAQAAAANKNSIFPPPPPAIELQARRLLRRFAMAPAVARVVAALAYAGVRP
jgi:hypothetical protein